MDNLNKLFDKAPLFGFVINGIVVQVPWLEEGEVFKVYFDEVLMIYDPNGVTGIEKDLDINMKKNVLLISSITGTWVAVPVVHDINDMSETVVNSINFLINDSGPGAVH